MQETAMALKTSPNIIEIVTGIEEEQIQSVLNSTLSFDQIEPEKLTVLEDDAKQVNYFERIKNILTSTPRTEEKLIDCKSTPLFVPIIMNHNNNKNDNNSITMDNSLLSLNIPQSLISNNYNLYGDDNPGSSIINSILRISSSKIPNNNNKLLIKKSTEFKIDIFHCKCCEKLKNICENTNKLFKWRSEPNLMCCDISGRNNSCLDNNNKQKTLFNNFQNIVLQKCQNNIVNNSPKKNMPNMDTVDNSNCYTEVDMSRFKTNENIVKTVDKLTLNVDNLKIGSLQLTQEIQQAKYGFQVLLKLINVPIKFKIRKLMLMLQKPFTYLLN